jgi:hypothetical protein
MTIPYSQIGSSLMSSSFTNQPSPHDPRSDEGYTPTPPSPERGHDKDEVAAAAPKLGSLAQKARGQKLKQARIIFFIIGVLTILVNLFDIIQIRPNFQKAVEKEIQAKGGPGMVQVNHALLQKEEDNAFLLGCVIDGAFIFTGVIFLILGVIIYRFPVPATIIGLVLYLLTFGAGLLIMAVIGEPEAIGRYVSSGLIVRIFIIIALIASIKSALAYENERRTESEFGGMIAGQ